MKISDLDLETKSIIMLAHAVIAFPTLENIRRLSYSLYKWDQKHEEEREENLLRFLGEALEDEK